MLWLLLGLTLAISLAYHRAGLRTSTAAFAALLLAFAAFGGSLAEFGLGLLIFAGVFVPLSLPTLRQEWLTRPLLDVFQRRLMPIQGEALASAVQGGEADRHLLGEHAPGLIAGAVTGVIAPQDLQNALRPALQATAQERLQALLNQRACAPRIAAAEGGLELSTAQTLQLLKNLAAISPTSTLPGLIAAFDAAAQLIQQHASGEQQAEWLPKLADGSLRMVLGTQSYWATGTTLPDQALVCRGLWKGKETAGLLARFDKIADASAALANEFLVSLQVRDPDNLLGAEVDSGFALVRIPGLLAEVQTQTDDTSVRLRSQDCFVPLSHLVGGASALTQGETHLQTAEGAWAANLIAIASGRAAENFEHLRMHNRIKQFHRLQPTQSNALLRKLGEAALDAYGLDSLQRLLAHSTAFAPSPRMAALALHAARSLSPKQDGPSLREPALDPIIARLNPTLQQSFAAATTTPYGMALLRFDEVVWTLMGEILAHQSHAFLLALSGGRMAGALVGGRHAQGLARYRAAIACCGDAHALDTRRESSDGDTDFALRDAMAQTLALAAALQAYVEDGQPRDQAPLFEAYARRCAKRIDTALDRFAHRQFHRRRRIGLRLLLLPLGQTAGQGESDLPRLGAALINGNLQKRLQPLLQGSEASPQEWSEERLEPALDAALDAQRRILQAIDNGRLHPAAPLAQIGEALNLNLVTAREADALRSALNLSEDWLAAAAARKVL